MAQSPKQLEAHLSVRHFFGAELRHWRESHGLSQDRLGRLVHVSGDEIGKVEKAVRWPSAALARACDEALGTGGVLSRLLVLVEHERGRETKDDKHTEHHLLERARQAWTGQGFRIDQDSLLLPIPGGRTLPGSAIPIQVHRARRHGDDLRGEIRRHGAGNLTVLIDEESAGSHAFVLDLRALPRHTGTIDFAVPEAYRLDSFTAAILWATVNLDTALLEDDAVLVAARRQLGDYRRLPHSAVTREAARGLSPVSHMWLGSEFCAWHVMRHLDGGTSHFWTREQRGEEACTWLLFRHKLAYLRRTGGARFPGATRSFCIPEHAVDDSPVHERVLMFLTAALMEALGIRVRVCVEPDYEDVEGFALIPGKRAVIANWVRGEGLWHVDMTPRRSTLRQFDDARGYAEAHSILGDRDPMERLVRFAEYLRLDWPWLQRRCREFSRVGASGLITPRSRLLSTAALDIACSFVGDLRVLDEPR